MNLHEYQGKDLLKKFNIPVQEGILATTEEEALLAYEKIEADTHSPVVVVKAQIHAGGRGKGCGVKVVNSKEQAQQVIQSEQAYREKLNTIAPSADRLAGLQATLTNIVNGAAPGPLKRAVAQQVIGSSGLSKEEQDQLLGQVNSQIA